MATGVGYSSIRYSLTPPRFLVNASLRLEERELQWNPISLDSSYRRHGYMTPLYVGMQTPHGLMFVTE